MTHPEASLSLKFPELASCEEYLPCSSSSLSDGPRMKPMLRVPLVLLCVLPVASGNLIQFADMIRRVTGKPSSLAYNGYGCYCGLGGWKQPRDETDWCCHAHDCCYGRMSSLGCDPKMEIYSYFIQERNIICGGETMCQRMICECDKAATLCFRTSAYSIRNIYFPNFLCRGATPPC